MSIASPIMKASTVSPDVASAYPVAIAVPLDPILASAPVLEVPSNYNVPGMTPELFGVLANLEKVTIRQHVKFLPKTCCSCPPCVKQENTYSIYGGLTTNSSAELFRVDEVSDDWNRCCCAPFQPLRMEVRQAIPMSGNSSEWQHLKEDFRNDWQSSSFTRRREMMSELYRSQPVLMSIVRDDGMRCCYKCPGKCLSTFVCFSCCQDGASIYAGGADDDPKGERGRPFALNKELLVGHVRQPICGGYCFPTLDLFTPEANPVENKEATAYARMAGPFCFGGWSELCCDFNFPVTTVPMAKEQKYGDLALMRKEKPTDLASAMKELMSDSDVYSVQFRKQDLSANQKMTFLAATLLADYIWFEGDTEKCSEDDSAVYCNFCYLSIFGATCPVRLVIPKKKN